MSVIDSLKGLGERTAGWETSWLFRRWAIFSTLAFLKVQSLVVILWVKDLAMLVVPLSVGGVLYLVTVYVTSAVKDDQSKRDAAVELARAGAA